MSNVKVCQTSNAHTNSSVYTQPLVDSSGQSNRAAHILAKIYLADAQDLGFLVYAPLCGLAAQIVVPQKHDGLANKCKKLHNIP